MIDLSGLASRQRLPNKNLIATFSVLNKTKINNYELWLKLRKKWKSKSKKNREKRGSKGISYKKQKTKTKLKAEGRK